MLQKPEINTIYVAKYVFFCFVVETVYMYIYIYGCNKKYNWIKIVVQDAECRVGLVFFFLKLI